MSTRKDTIPTSVVAAGIEGSVKGTAEVQIHGGCGYMAEYPVSRYYRGAKVLQIVEGISEVMRIILARELGL